MEHKSKSRLQEIVSKWDLDDQDNKHKPVTCSVTNTIDLTSIGGNTNVSLTSPYAHTSSVSLGAYPNTIYTTGTSAQNPWGPTNASTKITLNGVGADIEVNGWSLVDAVKRIEERLGLYQPNPKLEKEWEDLRALGEQYRQLEQHIKDKQATWDKLKAMPPPEVD